MTEDLEQRLRRLGDGVTPAPAAVPGLAEGVRRRRRGRRVGAVAGGVAGVAAVSVLVALLAGGRGPGAGPDPAAGSSVASAVPSDPAYTGFTCAGADALDQVPPLPDADQQAAVIDAVKRLEPDGFVVTDLVASPFGVIALVDLDTATLDLATVRLRYDGVAQVAVREHTDPDDGDAWTAQDQVALILADRVQQVAGRVDRVVRGRPGFVDLWHWGAAGTIPVFWHGAVPDDVAALAAEPFENGVRVTLTSVPYSRQELARAQDNVTDALVGGPLKTDWSTVGRCHDYSGIVVGVPDHDVAARSRLSAQLEEVVGMGVMVTYEEQVSPTLD